MTRIELLASSRMGLVKRGDDLAALILASLAADAIELRSGDVVVVAQKIVSKAEGRYVSLDTVTPSERANALAPSCDKDPRMVELILRESVRVLRCIPGAVIVENRHGVVLANAGIDRSNVEQDGADERVLLLPADPDVSCAALHHRFKDLAKIDVGVIINDSIGRAWRNGTQGAAIGVNGVPALQDMRGLPDLFGFRLRSTEVGTADEIAAAASLVMGQRDEGRPVVIVRGCRFAAPGGTAKDLIRPAEKDLFR